MDSLRKKYKEGSTNDCVNSRKYWRNLKGNYDFSEWRYGRIPVGIFREISKDIAGRISLKKILGRFSKKIADQISE